MMLKRVAWACSAVVAVSIQSASNALFAYELADGVFPVSVFGATLSAIGLAMGAGAVIIAVSQALAATEVFKRGATARPLALCILLPCMACSIASVVSHVLAFQQARVERGAAAEAAYASARAIRDGRVRERDAAQAAADTKSAELARRPATRGVGEIGADVQATRIPPDVWRVSRECTQIRDQWAASACDPLLRLRAEEATAVQRLALANEVEAEKAKLAAAATALEDAERELGRRPPPAAPWQIRVWLALLLPWALAIVVELCGTLGFVMAEKSRDTPASGRPAPRGSKPDPPPPASAAPGRPAGDLGSLIEGLSNGAATAPGCAVLSDGWIDAPQSALAKVLGVSAATVCRQLDALESSQVVATRKSGTRKQIKWL